MIVRCVLSILMLSVAGALRADDGVFVGLNDQKQLHLMLLDGPALKQPVPRDGWVIWSAGGKERWIYLKAGDRIPLTAAVKGSALALDNVRGSGGSGAGTGGMPLTTQLAQLRSTAIARDVDSDFLTPPRDGVLLDPRPTFRRKPRETAPKFPAAVMILTIDAGDAKTTIRVPFAEGADKIAFNDIPGLPKELSGGLPAGAHTLALEKGGVGPRTFTVEPDEARRRIVEPIHELMRLLGAKEHPVLVQFAVEQFLGQSGEETQPYLSDALDLFETIPPTSWTPNLREQHTRVLALLNLPPQERIQVATLAPGPLPDPTGIAGIDLARGLILAGQWSQALDRLSAKDLAEADDPRVRGLAQLYLAVILGESGQARSEETMAAFGQALELLKKAPASDRLRAHNNYADYLQGIAQDRLHNHAFQMAAGSQGTFTWILRVWEGARENYLQALALVDAKNAELKAAIHLNLARLDLLLGDVLQTLDPQGANAHLARAAYQRAGQAIEKMQSQSPLTRGQAYEVAAMLAFRQGDKVGAHAQSQLALAAYQNEGFLVGVENAQRLLALTAKNAPDAIRHLRIALVLSESLRDRVPGDRIGVTRAGFFARKAYMYDQLIERLVAAGQAEEALRIAELSRSRALQDLLFLTGTESHADNATRALSDILKSWPKDHAALEFFLGGEQALVFLVAPGGNVQAFPLLTTGKQPLKSRDLVMRVRSFLSSIEHQAGKLKNQLTSGAGFDASWQDQLHRFYQELIPAAALAELKQAKSVLIVPHHILHYFPFAALVTERDAKKRNEFEMVMPKYLVDEAFDLANVPSLTTWDLLHRRPVRVLGEAAALGIVDLPGTPRLDGVALDLKNLQKAFGAKVSAIKTAKDVTKAVARAQLKRPGVLLFAMHGENEPDRPLLSRLLLFPGPKEDGDLTAAELYQTPIATDLVVMSACYSGLADRSPLPGDDLFGLQRAFLQAGARSVVAGLWDVYDLTGPELIQSFFDHVSKGTGAGAALARSQRQFLQKLRTTSDGDPFVHPYFWAVYTVLGDPRTGTAKGS